MELIVRNWRPERLSLHHVFSRHNLDKDKISSYPLINTLHQWYSLMCCFYDICQNKNLIMDKFDSRILFWGFALVRQSTICTTYPDSSTLVLPISVEINNSLSPLKLRSISREVKSHFSNLFLFLCPAL